MNRRLAALLLATAACTSWQRQPISSTNPELAGREARVTRSDGAVYALRSASVEGDSLIGFTADTTRVAIATADIRSLETREFSAGRTAGLGGGLLVGAFIVGAIVSVLALLAASVSP